MGYGMATDLSGSGGGGPGRALISWENKRKRMTVIREFQAQRTLKNTLSENLLK